MSGYIYFIEVKKTNYFRIGFSSKSPSKKVKELQKECPFRLKLYRILQSPIAEDIFNQLLESLKDCRLKDSEEWFEIDKKTIQKIVKILGIKRWSEWYKYSIVSFLTGAVIIGFHLLGVQINYELVPKIDTIFVGVICSLASLICTGMGLLSYKLRKRI